MRQRITKFNEFINEHVVTAKYINDIPYFLKKDMRSL